MNVLTIVDEFLLAYRAADTRAIACWKYIADQALPPKERDPLRLYLSDLGKCPRQVAYRMLETEKDGRSPQSESNDRFMFHMADQVECTVAAAVLYAEKLEAFQNGVAIDRENWGGRTDIETAEEVIEVKSVRSNSFNYDNALLPGVTLEYGLEPYVKPNGELVKPKSAIKAAHVYQAGAYGKYGSHPKDPIVVVYDRGGSNTPQQYRIGPEIHATIDDQMNRLELVRGYLPTLPNPLPKVLKKRSYGKRVVQEPDWRCSYCDYKGSCSPDLSTSEWASLERGSWRWKSAADIDALATFAHENLPELSEVLP